MNKNNLIIYFAVLALTLFVLFLTEQNSNLKNELKVTNHRLSCLSEYVYKSNRETKYIHFSLDDVINIFKDLTKNSDKYDSIFDNKTLSYFKELHEKYGLKLSCYCFFDFSKFKLSEATDKYRSEFMANAEWLKFGFHGLESKSDYSSSDSETANITNDYNKVITELNRITGCLENNAKGLDVMPRIHCYKGSFKNLISLKNINNGINGVLALDDDRPCYYLNASDTIVARNSDSFTASDSDSGLIFISTDLRMEKISDPIPVLQELQTPVWNNRTNALILFTHEWALNKQVKHNIEEFCKYVTIHNYMWAYPQEISFK